MTRICQSGCLIVVFAVDRRRAAAAARAKTHSSPRPTVIVDGSSTVFRISKAAQEAFNRVDSDDHGGRRQPWDRRRLFALSAGRGRHRRCLAPAKPDEESKAKAQGIEWTRFVVGYDGITLVVNPKNDFVKSLARRAVEDDLGAWEQGQDLEGRRPGLARPEDHPLFTGQRLGDVRVLHRSDRRQGQEPARRRAAELRRQHAGQRRGRRPRRARLFRLCLLRRQPGQAPRRGRPERPGRPAGAAQPARRSPTRLMRPSRGPSSST